MTALHHALRPCKAMGPEGKAFHLLCPDHCLPFSVLGLHLLPSAIQARGPAQGEKELHGGMFLSPSLPGPQSGGRHRPGLCQQPPAEMDAEPGRMVSATLGEIHFPRFSGRKMWPRRHPSALQPSGKQASLSENSLERGPSSPVPGGPGGCRHPDSLPGCPSYRPTGREPWWSHTHPGEAKLGWTVSQPHDLPPPTRPPMDLLLKPCFCLCCPLPGAVLSASTSGSCLEPVTSSKEPSQIPPALFPTALSMYLTSHLALKSRILFMVLLLPGVESFPNFVPLAFPCSESSAFQGR